MKELELKPCPFCGNVDTIFSPGEPGDEHGWYRVMCMACDMRGAPAPTQKGAEMLWNTRLVKE